MKKITDYINQYLVLRKLLGYRVIEEGNTITAYGQFLVVFRVYYKDEKVFIMASCADSTLFEAFKDFEKEFENLNEDTFGCNKWYKLEFNSKSSYEDFVKEIFCTFIDTKINDEE